GPVEPVPLGTHAAVCIAVIQLGSHERNDTDDHGVARLRRGHYLGIYFELAGTKTSAGQPHLIGSAYTFSWHKKANFRGLLAGMLGTIPENMNTFQPSLILGKACQLTVVAKQGRERLFHVMGPVAPLMSGITPPVPVNQPLVYLIGKTPLPDLSRF